MNFKVVLMLVAVIIAVVLGAPYEVYDDNNLVSGTIIQIFA